MKGSGLLARQKLLLTEDGGGGWRRLSIPCPRVIGSIKGISLPTPGRGWVLCVGQPGAGSQAKAVYGTRDSGRSWHTLAMVRFDRPSRRGGLDSYGYPQGISFTAGGYGVIWASRGSALFVSRSGGRTWTDGEVGGQEGFGWWAQALSNRTTVALIQAERSYRLVLSRDFGRHWRVLKRWPR